VDNIIYLFFAGVIQGLTEFLPISSSGHLLILKNFFNMDNMIGLDFEIILHLGTVFSIIIYYRKDIIDLIKNFISNGSKLFYLIIIGCIPISIVGLLGKGFIESMFNNNISLLPYTFMLTGIFLFIAKDFNGEKKLTLKIVLIVGILQCLALFPGVSRSGITIASLLFLGINHKDAVRFSFLMAIPLILGAVFLTIDFSNYNINALGHMIFGSIISFLFGLGAIYLTNNLLKDKKYWLFSIYCFIISFVVFIWNLIL